MIKECQIGTFRRKKVDGVLLADIKHAWRIDNNGELDCANCDKTPEEVGYSKKATNKMRIKKLRRKMEDTVGSDKYEFWRKKVREAYKKG